jgi:metallo-beta-lactamase family protein
MHLIEANGQRVILDCGLVQGPRQEAARRNRELRIDGEHLDAVILSHAHIDHAGSLPTLVQKNFRGRVHATDATTDLSNIMLADSARIQVRDYEYLKKKGKPVESPLYTPDHARVILRQFRSHGYAEWFDVGPGIRALFQDAGHIIGSASVHVEVKEPGKDRVRITFTGDLGRAGLPILRDPTPLPPAEVIITESTYGGRSHGKEHGSVAEHMKKTLAEAFLAAARPGGKLVIPAFSVGRTQNVLYYLNELMAERTIPTAPIFIDSPLATDATDIIRRHPECFDEETWEKLDQDLMPLLPSHVTLSRTVEDSKRINHVAGTCVIISASGMCEFGRILHHLRNHLPDERSVIAFVGYQAHDTLGRRLVQGARTVRIYGEEIPVKAQLFKLNGFSAHADKDELRAALLPLKDVAEHTCIVHGEEDQALALRTTLDQDGFRNVAVPHEGDELVL